MKATGIILLLLVWQTSFSQWNDNFGDGDFEFNPPWTGKTTAFTVENNVLRLTAMPVSGLAYLVTPSDNINNASWQASLRLEFNPSSSNYAKIYLVADSEDLVGSLKGYFVKIGGSTDEISLYRQDGSSEIEIIDGFDGRVSLSTVQVQILVSRSDLGEWNLSSKLLSEVNWFSEGATIDSGYTFSNYFGISCIYTSSRSDKFYFDDIQVTGTPYVDSDPPMISSINTEGINKINISFNEPIDKSSASLLTNYLLNEIEVPNMVITLDSSVILSFSNPLEVLNHLALSGITDIASNQLADTIVQVVYIEPSPAIRGDIVVNEIMADPTPREDLPEIEYLELYNTSARAIKMTNWSLSDKASTTLFEDVVILPDSIIILTSNSDVSEMEPYGRVIGLSPWPSLNNTGDSLTLMNKQGVIIDQVVYDDSWYLDSDKTSGGWSIEKIVPNHPCSGYLNWQASLSPTGGTPGRINSVLEELDSLEPKLMSYSFTQKQLTLFFNEALAEANPSITLNNNIEYPGIDINYNQVILSFSHAFIAEQTNTVELKDLEDCLGNKAPRIKVSFIPDFDPPKIDTVYANYHDILEIYFDEAVASFVPEQVNLEGVGIPEHVELDKADATHFSILFGTPLELDSFYTLVLDSVYDLSNNMTIQSQYKFKYQPLPYPSFGEVLITELMADPSPNINLPEFEYIELLNTTTERLLLKGIVLADNKEKVAIAKGIIGPGERIILSNTSGHSELSAFGKAIGITNWPTLNNSGDEISLLDPRGNIIHNVNYSSTWYGDLEKEEGGWSLELIDEKNYCAGEKVWTASINLLGGTPGKANSTQKSIEDHQSPAILSAYTISNDSIEVELSESLNNLLPAVYFENQEITNQFFSSSGRDKIRFITQPLLPRKLYTIILSNFEDCLGNLTNEEQVQILLPEKAAPEEVVINEILFNPRADGVDFIELYNNSPKNISLTNWTVSNGSSTLNFPTNDLLSPYSYRVFTTSPSRTIFDYPKAQPNAIYQMKIPTLTNQAGRVVLRNNENLLIDSVEYKEDWHFSYLSDVEGVSLERIDYLGASSAQQSWASAASSAGYATPGYKNSQTRTLENSSTIDVSPRIIVPDGDGRDDFAIIEINNINSGALATISIYNLQGQLISQLENNAFTGSSASFRWDGTNSTGTVVPLGHYIILIDLILNNGLSTTYREKIVVASNF